MIFEHFDRMQFQMLITCPNCRTVFGTAAEPVAKPKPIFNIGDIVVCIKEGSPVGSPCQVGDIGCVDDVCNGDPRVKWNGRQNRSNNTGWYQADEYIRRI